MATDPDWDGIKRRLDIIILLLMESGPNVANSTTRKIEKLLGFGMSATEVAQVIGKKPNYVTAVVSGLKRSAGKKGEVVAKAAGDEDGNQ